MKKRILFITSIAIIMFMGACSNESPIIGDIGQLPDTDAKSGREISLNVTMPGQTTRVDLSKESDTSIKLTWVAGDELQLAFVQGAIKSKKTVTLLAENITAGGVSAKFDIDVPIEIVDGAFDLYGVYGGGGLSDTDPTKVILPTKTGDAFYLKAQSGKPGVQERKDAMLHFSSTGMQTTDPTALVIFKHLGSLFNINVKNTSPDYFGANFLKSIKELRLVGVPVDGKWAYNVGTNVGSYDLVAGKFLEQDTKAGNYLSFNSAWDGNAFGPGQELTFWAWYPSVPELTFPELKLEILYPDNQVNRLVTRSVNSVHPSTGNNPAMVNYVFATWNGLDLEFTDENYTPPTVQPTELAVTNWTKYYPGGAILPGDSESRSDRPAWVLEKLWDGNSGANSFFRTADFGIYSWPLSFSIDLGENQNLKLTHLRLFYHTAKHGDRWERMNLKEYEVWGSNNPNVDGSWDSWTKMGEFVYHKPGGIDFTTDGWVTRTAVDESLLEQAEIQKFYETDKAYRYIRFRVTDIYNMAMKIVCIYEIKLYGIEGESGNNGSGGGGVPKLLPVEW